MSSPGYAFRGSGSSLVFPTSAFGEVEVVSPTPTTQAAFAYGIDPLQVSKQTYLGAASVSGVNGEAVVTCGAQAGSYARMTGSRVTKYRPGQGTLGRWTARYSAGVVGNRQLAGLSNQEAGYQFGYVDDVFGIMYTKTGTLEIVTLTVTVAPAAPGSVLITLDGSAPVAVPVTVSGSTSICAYQISQANYSQITGGWTAQATGNVVRFRRNIAGPSAAAPTFAGNGTGAAATPAVATPGEANTEIFIPRSSWNGSTPVGFDPLKGNVYAVTFQYLGFGNALFYIEDGPTGQFVLVHMIRNANTVTAPVLRNPNLYLTLESRNTTNATAVSLVSASMAAFIDGIVGPPVSQFAASVTRGILAGVETPVLTVRANTVFRGRSSTGQLELTKLSVAADGNKPVTVRLYKGGTMVAAQFVAVSPDSCAAYDTLASSFSGGTLVLGSALAKSGNSTEDVTDLSLFLQAGDIYTVTAQSTNASDISVALSWAEDI